MKRLLLVGIAVVFLAGCAGVGNKIIADETEATVGQKIVEGKTSKADITNMYGQPKRISPTRTGENWIYVYSHASAKAINYVPVVNLFTGGSDVTTKTLVVSFDKNGVVLKSTLRETSEEVRRGIGS